MLDYEMMYNAEKVKSFTMQHGIERYRAACENYAESPSYEGAIVCDIIADVLREQYNVSGERLAEIEAEAYSRARKEVAV